MNKYSAVVRVGGITVKTAVFADSETHARLLLQYHYGMSSIVSSPTLAREAADPKLLDSAIKPIKPMTPAQSRINGLKQGVERSRQALKAEQDRQRQQRDAERRSNQQAQLKLS